MPLRKHGSIIPASAIAIAIAAAIIPTSASAATTTSEATTVVKSATTGIKSVTSSATSTAASAVVAASATTPTACPVLPVTKAFASQGDTADYSMAPGGNFETGAPGWSLKGGAKLVTGNETVGAATGSKSLRLPPLAVAVSPVFCVDKTHPTFRFAAKIDSLMSGYIAVVLYRDSAGKLTQAQFNASSTQSLLPSAKWFASDKAPLSVNIPLLNTNATASAQIMFMSTPTLGALSILTLGLTGTVSVDSLMIDPYRRG